RHRRAPDRRPPHPRTGDHLVTHTTRTSARALAVAALLLAGCRPPATNPGDNKPAPPPAPKAAKPAVKPARKVEQPGEVQAFEQARIYARIPGYVRARPKDIGDRVKKGDVLAELDVPEMHAELSEKQALVVQYESQVEQAEKVFEAA